MKLEFEGEMDAVFAEMVKLFNSMGLKVTPFDQKEIVDALKLNPAAEQPSAPKRRGRPPKAAPEPIVIDDDDADAEAVEQALNGKEEDVDPKAQETVNLHLLKEQTLARLRDLFMAGKGATIRELLKKHGHGALVFPEVDPKYFPAIKADIDRELGQ